MSLLISLQRGAQSGTSVTGQRLAAATTDAWSSGVTGDAADRFVINADGSMEWGGGAAAIDIKFKRSAAGVFQILTAADAVKFTFETANNYIAAGGAVGNSLTASIGGIGPGALGGIDVGLDTKFWRVSAALWGSHSVRYGDGYFVEFSESASDPAAPAANMARLFAKDSGGGKTQLVVRFPSGATQVIAVEP